MKSAADTKTQLQSDKPVQQANMTITTINTAAKKSVRDRLGGDILGDDSGLVDTSDTQQKVDLLSLMDS